MPLGKLHVMSWRATILGGIGAAMLGGELAAEPLAYNMRPLSRTDAQYLRDAATLATLASSRPQVRPDYMIRQPVTVQTARATTPRPLARSSFIPRTRWDSNGGDVMWTRAAMSAVAAQGDPLISVVPRDIAQWCPAYADNPPQLRRAFWVGMMSALSKHESTYDPDAVGGNGSWFGLLQILPSTARAYGCRARSGEALKDPEENLSCAIRIMARTVVRDRAVALNDGRWRGVAADWGPMTNRAKISEMSDWTSQQSYCVPRASVRPQARPPGLTRTATADAAWQRPG